MKLYGISAWGDRPSDDIVAAAQKLAGETLPLPATAEGRHGVGFVGAHEGAAANFAFVSWWAKTYELNHVLYRAPKGTTEFAPVERTLFGCTWDLHLIAFERDAWIAAMLRTQDALDLDAYLAATFNSDV